MNKYCLRCGWDNFICNRDNCELLNKISEKADTLTGEDGMIELDPNNPLHREWFEEGD